MEVRVVIAFFLSDALENGRAQFGITLFYLFLDDLVELQIVSVSENLALFLIPKGFEQKKFFSSGAWQLSNSFVNKL